jgi:hypothetical protein
MYCRSLVVGVLLLAPVAAMSAKATSEAAQDSSPATMDEPGHSSGRRRAQTGSLYTSTSRQHQRNSRSASPDRNNTQGR